MAVFTGAGGAVAAQRLRLAHRRITFRLRLCRHGPVGLHDDFLDALQRSERAGAVEVLALIPGALDGRGLVGAGAGVGHLTAFGTFQGHLIFLCGRFQSVNCAGAGTGGATG